MDKTKHQILKGALFAGLAALAVSTAQAQYEPGDVVVSFTTGSGNDLIYDLGAVSSLTTGETWNLGSLLTGNLALSKHPVWAVVADFDATIYTSYLTTHPAAPGIIKSAYITVAGSVDQIGNNIATGTGSGSYANPPAAQQYSFYYCNNPQNPDTTTIANAYAVVGGAFTGSSQAENFWAAVKGPGGPTTGAVTLFSQFSLASDGVLTYGATVSSPKLTIILSGTDVILSWPSTATGFTLQSTPSVAGTPVWAAVSTTPVIVNGQFTVTLPVSGLKTFYRLEQ